MEEEQEQEEAMEPRRRGRPRSFDDDTALLTAIDVFWAKGYEGTSIRDLTEAMGINAPSLYAAFGDKHSLYLKAIDRYATNDACAPLVAFDAEPDIGLAVRAFLTATADYATSQASGNRGCFLGNCVSVDAGEIEGVEARLQQAIAETDARLKRRFDAEKRKGTLPADFPSLARARLLFDLRQGMVLRARAGLGRRSMTADLDDRVTRILTTA